jgi:methylthioribose-1-phosphate isomerase
MPGAGQAADAASTVPGVAPPVVPGVSQTVDRSGVPVVPDPPRPSADTLPDPGRRAFFKSFGRQAFETAAQVVGMTNAVSRATTNVAVNVVGLAADPGSVAGKLTAGPGAPAIPVSLTTTEPAPHQATAIHKSPYRLEDDRLILLDQRGLPDRLDEQVCRRGSDVAFYLRVMAVRGGPLMGQLAAYGLVLTAREFASRTYPGRQAEWNRTCRSLVAARPGSRMLRFAIDRMTALHATFGPEADQDAAIAELRAQADALAMEAQLDHAAIAGTLAALLPRPEGRPLQLLVHGAPGTSTGGHIGTGLNAISLLAGEAVPVKVWITETRPYLDGARLATWELAPTDVPMVVLPDSAVAYLLDHETIDAVILGAEWIAANGDTSNVVGSRVVAEMAAIARHGPVPVYIAAPATTIDPSMAEGDALPVELRPGREIAQNLAGWKPDRVAALLPALDVIPAARIAAFVTEQGTIAPDATALAAALAERASRRTPIGPPWEPPARSAATVATDAADAPVALAAPAGAAQVAG